MPRGYRTEDSVYRRKADERVHRDPDIGGVFVRFTQGPHIRSNDPEFKASKPSSLKGK